MNLKVINIYDCVRLYALTIVAICGHVKQPLYRQPIGARHLMWFLPYLKTKTKSRIRNLNLKYGTARSRILIELKKGPKWIILTKAIRFDSPSGKCCGFPLSFEVEKTNMLNGIISFLGLGCLLLTNLAVTISF